VRKADFPKCVSGLIHGVFEAIVDASVHARLVDLTAWPAHSRWTDAAGLPRVLLEEGRMKNVARALVLLVIAAVPAHAGVSVSLAPEPATIGLVATGIGVLAGLAWWRSRNR